MKIMQTQEKKISILSVTLVASLGGFLFGFDMAVISGVLPLVQKQFNLSAFQQGWFVSAALVGCIVGVAFSGELADRIGRRRPLLLSASLFLLSALGCAFAPSLFLIIAARFLGGLGIGLASNVVPLYISEIAPAKSRGRLITYYQFALTFGILVAYLTNAALVKHAFHHENISTGWFASITTTEVWRAMLGLGSIPAVLFLFGLIIVPESPRWLLQRGRMAEARGLLASLGIEHSSKDEEQSILQSNDDKVSYKELFSLRWRKALLIGLLLPLFSQFSGINAIIYYGPSILSNAGISLDNSLMSQVIFGAANMLFTLIAIWKVDSAGRRPLYLAGTAGAAISLLGTGICFAAGATGTLWLLLCVLSFLACFAFSIGPLKFVVAAEIFPNKIRGRAMAISIMVMWIADTIVGQLTPVLLKAIGTAATFWTFAGFCVIAFITVYKLLPETKGKSLEQIEAEWKGRHDGIESIPGDGPDSIVKIS
jgi:SP family arabinose:H+ symporter-like MFS transporter